MALLLAGVALGATAVALSESDRERYYNTRSMYDYLGQRHGADVYRDRVTGEFFVDNGWDVRKVGRRGWKPHPIDKERLSKILKKYNPSQVQWTNFILATYIDHTDDLWKKTFQAYRMPKKPKKPTTLLTNSMTKSLRKGRYGRYEEELEEWERKAKVLKQEFYQEQDYWNKRKQEYNHNPKRAPQKATSGLNLLRRALSSSEQNTAPQAVQSFMITVPQGKGPGDTIQVNANGAVFALQIPNGCYAGSQIQFSTGNATIVTPAHTTTPAPVASTGVTPNPPPAATPSAAPPPAMSSAPPPAMSVAPPPAMSAAAPPPASRPPPPAMPSTTSSAYPSVAMHGVVAPQSTTSMQPPTANYNPPPAVGAQPSLASSTQPSIIF